MNRYVKAECVRIARAATIVTMILLPGAAVSRADTVTLVSARDNTLIESTDGSVSNGSGPSFFVGDNSASNTRRGVLYFNVASAVPDSATIDSVTLTLHLSRTSESIARLVSVHRLLADWGEGSSFDSTGAGKTPGTNDATWIHRFYPTVFWQNPGGDFDATILAQTAVNLVGFYSWTSSGLTADVQAWLDTPATNFGWLLQGVETAMSARRFDTRENSVPAYRPQLTIHFTPKSVPVESTTWGGIKARSR